jgi:PAS domain S-box-containing protein
MMRIPAVTVQREWNMHQLAAFQPYFDHGEALDSLSRLLEVVGSCAPLRAQLRDLALYVERLSRDTRCSIHLFNPVAKTLHSGAAPHLPETYNAAIDGVTIGDGVGSCGTAAARRAMVVVADIQASPLWKDYRDLARAHGLAACWSVPVIYGNGELLGTFAMYYSKPREPSAAELDVLRIAGPLAAVVIQRHRDAQRLKESEERFGAVFENAAIGMALVSPEGKWLRVNPAICRIVGYSADELLQIDFQSITHPDDLMIDLAYVREMLEGARTCYHMEKRYLHKAGHTIWVLLSVSLVRDECGIPLYFISQTQDITERHRLEHSLTEIMSSEQRQLGRDLHDGLAQELTGLSLLASAFATKAERGGSALAEDARALSMIATTAVATCRDIVQGVSPLTESNGGLAESLSRLASRASALGTSAVRFRCAGELPTSLNWYTRSQLYCIAQEALNNALTHSQAASIDMSLQVEPRCVRIKVANPCQSGPIHEAAQISFGMATMKFRAAAINARITVLPQPAGGTVLICDCPYDLQTSGRELPVA